MEKVKTNKQLLKENEELRARLQEAQETLDAIRSGEVDALVVSDADGERVFTLKGAEQPYRIVVESMNEGAITLTSDGAVLYCNERFAEMVKTPLEKIIGLPVRKFVEESDRETVDRLIAKSLHEKITGEIALKSGDAPLPVLFSARPLPTDNAAASSVIVTGIADLKRTEGALKELNDTLERRVTERTAELQATNEALRASRLASLNLVEDAVAARRQMEEAYRELQREADDRKRAEAALRESEERLRYHVENSPLAVVEWNADFLVTRWAGEAEKIFGWSAAETVGKPIMDLRMIFEEDIPIVQKTMEKLTDGVSRHVVSTNRNYTKNGEVITCTWYNTVLQDTAGKMKSVMSQVMDITERKRAEEALRASEEQFRALADSIPNLTWWANADGYLTWYNQRWYDYTGTTPAQMEGWGWQSVHDPDALPAVMERWKTSLATGEPFDMEFPLRGADGTFRTFLTRVMPLKDAAGKVIRWFGTNTDISAIRQAEQALLESEERLRIFIEHAPASLAMFDRDMRYISFSRRWLSDYGLGDRDLRGMSHYDVFPEIPERWKAIHRRALAGEVVRDDNDRFDRADGSAQWLQWEVRPWHDAAGEVAGIVVFSEDITERKKAEDSLKAAHAELERKANELAAVNRELEAFSYTVSHDLKTPLRSIDGFARAVLEDYGDNLGETARDYLRRVNAATLRMNQFIDAMLNMARLTRGELHERTVDLGALAQIIAHDLRTKAPERQVEFVIAGKVRTKGDQDMLVIVLQNLMENAWKFTAKHAQAKIEFGSRDMDGRTVYFVRDDGAGFDMKFAEKLFQPFIRMHAETEFPGLGIGLAIAHRIVLRHAGRMWAESEPEKGATFFFTLG